MSGMVNIVVAVKQLPDLHHVRIRNHKPVLDNIPMVLGDIDKSALEVYRINDKAMQVAVLCTILKIISKIWTE